MGEAKSLETREKILIVEDNLDLLGTLKIMLGRVGFDAVTSTSAKEAYQKICHEKFDLAILDVNLGDQSGFDLCQLVREKKSCKDLPIIFLSARSQEIDRVVGFELGADDYITKPFSVKELVLRIKAILRRKTSSTEKQNVFSFGKLEVDLNIPRVQVASKEIGLTSLELKLITLLYKRRGRVQTRMQLLNSVWNIDASITTRTVDTHIKRLREKIGPASNYIKTVRGIGYRFITHEEFQEEFKNDDLTRKL